MNRSATQFWVAIIGVGSLSIITGIAVTLSMLGYASNQGELLLGMLVGGLVSVVTMAATYLFRLNGSGK